MPAELVRMANQIAANFHAYPEDEAVAGVAMHLQSFWEPRMLADLKAAVAEGRAEGLDPLAEQALTQHNVSRPNRR